VQTQVDLNAFKRKASKKHKINSPKNIALLKTYHKLLKNKTLKISLRKQKNLEQVLRTRPVRSLSGIINVSVLTKPYPCPGKCIFCPQEKDIPKSYLSKEPAVQRAILNNFHPYRQVVTRLEGLTIAGHPIDKIELRIIGGTWSYYPKTYQSWFIKQCFKAANEFSNNSKSKLQTLDALQKQNEKAKARIIGVTIETRPDYVDAKEVKQLRNLGVTRVEIGAQSIYDDILLLNKRGHDIETTAQATKLLKNAGFKVSYQMMPNLLGSTTQKDIKMFKELFDNPDFKPDLLKIYPLALMKSTPLYKRYKQKKYKPYSHKELTKVLIGIKKHIPYWCRVERVIRDIPAANIVCGGSKMSNLRQIIKAKMLEEKKICKCIRCREVGGDSQKEKLLLMREEYDASGGKEIFLSFENKDRTRLYSLLRLRLTSQWSLPEIKNSALLREVHTYGQLIPLGDKTTASQHKGLGRKLIQKAESIAKKAGYKRVAIIAGIGARPYYKNKLSYRLKGTYMIKSI